MRTILVTGDFVVDHHIYEGRRRHFGDQRSRGVCVQEELGGAALIHRLLAALSPGAASAWRSCLAIDESSSLQLMRDCGADPAGCVNQPFAAYAFWRPYPSPERNGGARWRVSEAMGFGGEPATVGEWPWTAAADRPTTPSVLVISDGGMGFRARRNVRHWNVPIRDQRLVQLFRDAQSIPADKFEQLTVEEPEWIVLKTAAPIGEGDLWRELSCHHADRLVVIVSADELRLAGVRLSPGLSWEQTLEDLQSALETNGGLGSLTRSRHLIISFGSEGALWISREGDVRKAVLLFDPQHVEGERRVGIEGQVYGMLSCLAAAVSAEVAAAPDQPDIELAMRRGAAAMRHLWQHGHGDAAHRGAGFPASAVAAAMTSTASDDPLQSRSFQLNDPSSPVRTGWSLLALHEAPGEAAAGAPLHGIARRILLQGSHALRAPTLSIGDFFTADRGEIEALRSLRLLVNRYLNDRKADKPLSIGVFGPPGAGKSFAVKELARSLLGARLGWLEFNLSQFNGPADLIGALHQVRDKILEGKLPVAFFDEFDSQNFTWLKYLLAPMQDGRFQEVQLSHPVGQCLFVFAGGTSHAFEQFASRGDGAGTPGHASADHFVLSKGPDFASRLDGKLNVIGPNPRRGTPGGGEDIYFPVRRALFIRSRLKCTEMERLKIHPGLATALLELPNYKHGSRSLAKLLEPFRMLRRSEPDAMLGLSMLPPLDQLALHVELSDFESLIRRDEEAANRLGVDQLAAAVHQFYRTKACSEGWIKSQHDRDFVDLSPFDQASNRAAARRIPSVIALAGLKLVPGTADAQEQAFAKRMLAFHDDLLAEAEHDGWMDWHLENGWSQSDTRDEFAQLHNRLVSYRDLPPQEQDKDKAAVQHYPEIAALANLKIVSSAGDRDQPA